MLINLQILLSIDRFWAICHPMSYLKQKTHKRRISTILICVALGVLFGLCSGLYVCAINPLYNPQNNNTITNCSKYVDFKMTFKGFFSLYTVTAMAVIIGLNGFVIISMFQRVSFDTFTICWATATTQFLCRKKMFRNSSPATLPKFVNLLRRWKWQKRWWWSSPAFWFVGCLTRSGFLLNSSQTTTTSSKTNSTLLMAITEDIWEKFCAAQCSTWHFSILYSIRWFIT